jgi:hypothetical protein
MRIKKFTATAVLAVAATAIATGTANAAPAVHPAQPIQAQAAPISVARGIDNGVSYTSTLAADAGALVTTVANGSFSVTGHTVSIHDQAGNVVGSVPTTVAVRAREVQFTPVVDRSGSRLTLTPVAASMTGLKDIGSQQWFLYELNRAATGGIVGAIIGGLLGLLGFVVSAIPGAIIGGVIGLLVAGGQPLISSGSAYFSGQP